MSRLVLDTNCLIQIICSQLNIGNYTFCQRPSGGLCCPSSGHSGTKPWASTDQATGIHCPCGLHRVPKRWAFFGHSLQVGGFVIIHNASWLFWGTWMTFLWYFYQINDTSMILLVKQSEMYHSSILLYFSHLSLYSVDKMILWYFFS